MNKLFIGDKVECLQLALSQASKFLEVETTNIDTHPDFMLVKIPKGKKGMGVNEANEILEKFRKIKHALDNSNKIALLSELGLLKEKDKDFTENIETLMFLMNFLEGYYNAKLLSAPNAEVIRALRLITEEKSKVNNLYKRNELFYFIAQL